MLDNVSVMFDDRKNMMKRLKKKSYQAFTEYFRGEHGHYFEEMKNHVDSQDDKAEAARELSVSFTKDVKEKFGKGKNSKVPAYLQVDLNFFMIYYVFPAILDLCGDNAKLIADTLCNEWGNLFQDSKIGYTTYEKIYDGFQEKLLGLFRIGS